MNRHSPRICEYRLLTLLALAGCGHLAAQNLGFDRLTGAPVPYSLMSGLTAPEQTVIRDEAAWVSVWQRLHSIRRPVPTVPAVDFSRNSVVLVALGRRNTGGYAVEILAAERAGDQRVVIRAIETSPGSGCIVTEALTAPVDLVILPTVDAVVDFAIETRESSCD